MNQTKMFKMEGTVFTESEVRRKLAELGYHDVPKDQMKVFMQDLSELIKHETSHSSEYDTSSATGENDLTTDSDHMEDQERYAISRYKKKPFSKSQVYDDVSLDKENFGYDERLHLRDTSSVSSLSSSVNTNLDNSNASTVTRRKVARKRDGMVRVFDETFQEEDSEASDITLIEERLQSLPLRDDYDECQTDDSASTYSTSTRARNERGFLPSYIRPSTSRSTQGRSKTFDPVSRYHQFKEEWKLQGVPGESRHDTLRWSVREQMLNCQVYERPQHSHRPNNYQVPTKKKRQALRWEVRCALAKI